MTRLRNWMGFLALAAALCGAPAAAPLAAQDDEAALSSEDFELPESDKVSDYVDFIKKVKAIEPGSRDDYILYQRRAPKALAAAAEQIKSLEKDQKSEAWHLAATVLLGQEVQEMQRKSFLLVKPTPAQYAAMFDKVKTFIDASPKAANEFSLAMTTAQTLELGGSRELAAKSYAEFGEAFAKSKDAPIAESAKMLAGAARRLSLVGTTMQLKGKTFDGKPFDLASLKGKAVLVDFWATWCGPCLTEQKEHIAPNYEKYKAKGFEVVGVSIDADRSDLERFMSGNKLPWVVVHDEGNPTVTQYGIYAIPTVVFIGKDGKVKSLDARGEDLAKLLEEELGPPAAPAKPAPATTAPAKATPGKAAPPNKSASKTGAKK